MKNLDTGEEMDLIEAEDKLPPSINPLSLHIMRLTSEYVRYVFFFFYIPSPRTSFQELLLLFDARWRG